MGMESSTEVLNQNNVRLRLRLRIHDPFPIRRDRKTKYRGALDLRNPTHLARGHVEELDGIRRWIQIADPLIQDLPQVAFATVVNLDFFAALDRNLPDPTGAEVEFALGEEERLSVG